MSHRYPTAAAPPVDDDRAAAGPLVRAAPPWNKGRCGTRVPGVDGRTTATSRYRRRVAELTTALGREPSPRDRMLLHRVVGLSLLAEEAECRLAAGLPVDTDDYRCVTYALMHAVAALGLPRGGGDDAPAGPSLAEILERHGGGA